MSAARIPWTIRDEMIIGESATYEDTEFPINPLKDTGWRINVNYAKLTPLQGVNDIIQFMGRNSRVRMVEGWLRDLTFKAYLESWLEDRDNRLLQSHDETFGVWCRLVSFVPERRRDITTLDGTWFYTATFLKRPVTEA
jgi:hypothetical protein